MALPPQVQAALDAAEATLTEARSQDPTTTEAAFAAADAPVEQVVQATPQPVVAPVETPTPPKVDEWEHKYKILQGKYNGEVPDLHRRVRGLEADLHTAISRLDEASKAKERQPEPQKAADPKDIENFGSDLVEMVQRVTGSLMGQLTQAFDGKIKSFESEIATLKEQLVGTTQSVAMSAEQSFFDRLTKLVPEWEKINVDQGFLSWLVKVDPVYGLPRQAALQRAQEALNADHAAAVFNAYAPATPAVPAGPDPLEQQVSPKSSGSEAPQPVQSQIISAAQITKFYDEVRQGLYRGQDAEVQRIEQVINAALAEGRVR